MNKFNPTTLSANVSIEAFDDILTIAGTVLLVLLPLSETTKKAHTNTILIITLEKSNFVITTPNIQKIYTYE
jgi:hypothetical protein